MLTRKSQAKTPGENSLQQAMDEQKDLDVKHLYKSQYSGVLLHLANEVYPDGEQAVESRGLGSMRCIKWPRKLCLHQHKVNEKKSVPSAQTSDVRTWPKWSMRWSKASSKEEELVNSSLLESLTQQVRELELLLEVARSGGVKKRSVLKLQSEMARLLLVCSRELENL
eukprot:TRINITY_DN3530_c0_g2_i1.p1 TRINITY_DN3530_c0_g2~~TRINITY_DN3530_c0_g2_i1.p1  ORF type:complete len:168 (+),score=28.07 TRINITY_DN3530_c0_g2_i1:422-925(+)